MKSSFNKAVALGLCLAWAAPAAAGDVHRKMELAEGHLASIEEQMKAGKLEAGAPDHARAIAALFLELDRAPSEYSKDPQWHAWLAESAEASTRLAADLEPAAPDLAAARLEIKRIDDLREQAHTHFRPGLLGRIERWLAKRKRSRNEKTAAAPAPAPVDVSTPSGVRAP